MGNTRSTILFGSGFASKILPDDFCEANNVYWPEKEKQVCRLDVGGRCVFSKTQRCRMENLTVEDETGRCRKRSWHDWKVNKNIKKSMVIDMIYLHNIYIYTHAWLHVWLRCFSTWPLSKRSIPKFQSEIPIWVKSNDQNSINEMCIHRFLCRWLYKLPITWYTIYPLPSRSGNEKHIPGLCLSWAFMKLQPWMINKTKWWAKCRNKVRIEHSQGSFESMIFLFPRYTKRMDVA